MIKIISLLHGKEIDKILFAEIKKAILNYIEPRDRLLIADRTNFLQMCQNNGEAEVDFLARLNSVSINCKWDELKNNSPSDELIKLKFVSGLFNQELKIKLLEKLQLNSNITIDEIIDICQMSSQLNSYVNKNTESICLLYTSPSPRDKRQSRMPSSA